MSISYKNTKEFEPGGLQRLFLSVDWSSGHYPERLAAAMRNSAEVFTAWDGSRLVGLINALDDKTMTAYIHFLLVEPAYQGKGVGKELIRLMREKYKDYLRLVLVAYDNETGFYRNCGFKTGEGTTAMFITSLWD